MATTWHWIGADAMALSSVSFGLRFLSTLSTVWQNGELLGTEVGVTGRHQ